MKLRTKKSLEGFPITIGDAIITVNPMSASEMTRLRESHSKIKRGVEKINGAAMTAEMFDRVALGWEGINDEDGKPIACTRENKLMIYEQNPDFVAEVLREMDDVAAERRVGMEGNLLPGPSGTSAKGK